MFVAPTGLNKFISSFSPRLNVYRLYEVKVSGDGNCQVCVVLKQFGNTTFKRYIDFFPFICSFVHSQTRCTSHLNITSMFAKKL